MSIAAVGGSATPFYQPFQMGVDLQMGNSLLESCRKKIKFRVPRETQFGHTGTNRLGKLFCRTGYILEIHKKGQINGTKKMTTKFGVLEFFSMAFGLVSIRGKESGLFLCMNKSGKLYATEKHSTECIFLEKMLQNWYNTYTSCKYPNKKRRWFVALNGKGRPQLARRTRRKHKTAQFLVLHLDDQSQSQIATGTVKQSELNGRLAARTGKPMGFRSAQQEWIDRHKPPRRLIKTVNSSTSSGSSRYGRTTFAWRNATQPL